MPEPLIFDIGANRGQDTRFYIAKGFRVVSVEANPNLCEEISADLPEACITGLLTIVNRGVGREHGILPFYVNEFSEWSSFVQRSKATKRLKHDVLEVPLVPLSALIAEHGVPYYIKIDIEGMELDAIASLDDAPGLPPFLSFEINNDWQAILDRLKALGFEQFQIVRQGAAYLATAPVPAREGCSVAQVFSDAHSGAFGRDLPPEAWQDHAAVLHSAAEALASAEARKARGEKPGWFDIHARLGAAMP